MLALLIMFIGFGVFAADGAPRVGWREGDRVVTELVGQFYGDLTSGRGEEVVHVLDTIRVRGLQVDKIRIRDAEVVARRAGAVDDHDPVLPLDAGGQTIDARVPELRD